jgi:hypothetical protein
MKIEVELFADIPENADYEVGLDGMTPVEQAVIQLAARQLAERFQNQVKRELNTLVYEKSEKMIQERLEREIDAALAEGWQKTDHYGAKSGPVLTLRDRISEVLTKAEDRYGSNGGMRWIDARVKEAVAHFVATDFKAELAEAKERLRGMIDDAVMGQLRDALKNALGFR